MLKRDIIEQKTDIRKRLDSKCKELFLFTQGGSGVSGRDGSKRPATRHRNPKKEWDKYCEVIENENRTIQILNKNIDKYNLVVPMLSGQMFHFNLKKEADKILKKYLDIAETKINDTDSLKPQNNDYNQADEKHGAPLVIEVLLSTFKSLFAQDKKKS